MVGAVDADQLADLTRGSPQILEFYNVAGDPDLLMHLRDDHREDLADVVNALRRSGEVAGTRTLIVLDLWSRSESAAPPSAARRSRCPTGQPKASPPGRPSRSAARCSS